MQSIFSQKAGVICGIIRIGINDIARCPQGIMLGSPVYRGLSHDKTRQLCAVILFFELSEWQQPISTQLCDLHVFFLLLVPDQMQDAAAKGNSKETQLSISYALADGQEHL